MPLVDFSLPPAHFQSSHRLLHLPHPSSRLFRRPASPVPMEIAYREPTRKHGFVTGKAFDAKTGMMPGVKRAREILQERFQSELVAVRGLLAKAAAVRFPSAPSVKGSRPGFFLLAEEPPAKKRKASPPFPVKKLTAKERNQLYADLAKVAKLSESHVLPAHILELLKKQSRHGICDDYIEIEMHAVQDAALVEIQKQLESFVQERATHQHDQAEDEDVDIVGGVSPLPIRPAPVQLVEEDEEYVDICGDASPVKNLHSEDATISGSSGPAERAAATRPTRELVAQAKESLYLERQWKEATSRAREKARQEVVETEGRAMPNDSLHPEDLKRLRIDEHNTARPNNVLRWIGLFRKADDYQEQQQHQSFQEDLEEGEIRL